MDMQKVEHFTDFIFSNRLLQDVAYGVMKLKYGCGDEETIPHMILKSKYSHTTNKVVLNHLTPHYLKAFYGEYSML